METIFGFFGNTHTHTHQSLAQAVLNHHHLLSDVKGLVFVPFQVLWEAKNPKGLPSAGALSSWDYEYNRSHSND
jgi:hypothetical protein